MYRRHPDAEQTIGRTHVEQGEELMKKVISQIRTKAQEALQDADSYDALLSQHKTSLAQLEMASKHLVQSDNDYSLAREAGEAASKKSSIGLFELSDSASQQQHKVDQTVK